MGYTAHSLNAVSATRLNNKPLFGVRGVFSTDFQSSWKMKDNDNWLAVTRPILEAYFHAKYFLERVVRYGEELEQAPACLPSGWAAVLYLYHLR